LRKTGRFNGIGRVPLRHGRGLLCREGTRMSYRISALLFAVLLAGCAAAPADHGDRNLTVGTVQKEVRVGMSGAEVAAVLGSPNIVSTDENRNEVWIYDRISSQTVQTDVRGAVAVLRFLSDIGPIAASGRTQTESTSQQTLTVIIKFDENDRVRDFAYHTSRF
jgi:outer membrane protein assembly factor BamE (lipoprotein component of BamABCDE complex)